MYTSVYLQTTQSTRKTCKIKKLSKISSTSIKLTLLELDRIFFLRLSPTWLWILTVFMYFWIICGKLSFGILHLLSKKTTISSYNLVLPLPHLGIDPVCRYNCLNIISLSSSEGFKGCSCSWRRLTYCFRSGRFDILVLQAWKIYALGSHNSFHQNVWKNLGGRQCASILELQQ